MRKAFLLKCPARIRKDASAFSLLELLLAMAVVAIIGILVAQAISYATTLWRASRDRVSALQDSRLSLSRIESALSRAVLNTRLDYADSSGNPRVFGSANFIPTQVLRASDLHFVSGPAAELLPVGAAATTPGHAVFFQAPLGITDNSSFSQAGDLLNSAGFFVEFGEDSSLPAFLRGLPGWNSHRYRLKEWIQPAEDNAINASANRTYDWFQDYLPATPGGSPPAGSAPARTLAEDVFALFLLPSAPPTDETAAGPVSSTYRYDSKAWQGGSGLAISGNWNGSPRTAVMRNQLPAFVKLAAFSLERSDAERLQRLHGNTPPTELAVPTDLFTDAANFEADILEFERRLLAMSPPIRPRIFRTTIPLKSAKWTND